MIYLSKLKNTSSKLTRIRLDLEEYDFEILHISGESNVVADALSRMSIEDLKNQYDNEILAITRSMTRKRIDNINDTDETLDKVRVYEEMHAGSMRKIPRIKTKKTIVKNNELNQITVSVFQNHRKLFDCILYATPNERITLKVIISKLESRAIANKIKKFQWPL